MRTRIAAVGVLVSLVTAGCAVQAGVPPTTSDPATTAASPDPSPGTTVGEAPSTVPETPRLDGAERDAVIATARDYAEAVMAGNWEVMALTLADPAPDVGDQYSAIWGSLVVEEATIVIIADRPLADGPEVDLGVTLELRDAGAWDFAVTLPFVSTPDGWRIRWSPAVLHPSLEEGDTLILEAGWPERAAILDRTGNPLVSQQPVVTIGVVPQWISDQDAVLAVLADLAGIPPQTVLDELERPGIQPDWFLPVGWLPAGEFEAVGADLEAVDGIATRPESGRVATAGSLTDRILGTIGPITAEQLALFGPPYEAGDLVGRSGLEAAMQSELAGLPSVAIQRINRYGRIVETLEAVAGRDPVPVQTTLDLDLQRAAIAAIEGFEEPAAIVVLDVETGGIRAAVSRPSDEFDRAFGGQYPPGSTFKIVTAAALLGAGVDPLDPVDCPDSVTINGREFSNAAERNLGTVAFRTAFAESCNTTFAQLAAGVLGTGDLRATAEAFGFNASSNLSVPAAGGQFPDPPDLAGRAAAAFGQAQVLASPLQMASVAAAVAGGGWVPPRLLVSGDPPDRIPLDAGVAADLADLMLAAVTEGTGAAAGVDGEEVRGKTGSAEFGTGEELGTHAWFVGYWDGLAFAIVIEGGGYGGRVAAPVAADFIRRVREGS
jgi:cell division protein FtsI/penicillin-binding protein 2